MKRYRVIYHVGLGPDYGVLEFTALGEWDARRVAAWMVYELGGLDGIIDIITEIDSSRVFEDLKMKLTKQALSK